MSSSRGDGSKRISNACLPCQKRKAKCDGERPTCSACDKRGFICEYALRKTRGPGKSKEYIQMLEERVQKLQSSLGSSQTPQDTSKQLSENNQAISASISEGQSSSTAARSDELRSGLEPPNPEINFLENEVRNPTQNVTLLMKGLSFLSKVDTLYGNVRQVMSKIKPGGFPSTTFSPLIPQIDDPRLVVHIIEDINTVYPLITQKSLAELFSQQYAVGDENSTENPARWALLNSYIAMLLQWKVANTHRQNFEPLKWAFLKNAYSVFPDLLIRGKTLLSCQGILFMTMAIQGSADVWVSRHMLSAAARLAQALGLHHRSSGKTVPTVESEESLRTFWLIYILDASEVMKSGLPPCVSPSDGCSELPDENPVDGLGCISFSGIDQPLNIFRYRAELAIIQSKIHEEFFSEKAIQRDSADLLVEVEAIHGHLDAWKNGLPLGIRPFFEDTPPEEPEPQLVLLHFTYYSCIAKLAAADRRLSTVRSSNEFNSRLNHSQEGSMALVSGISAARATIRLLQFMDAQSFSCLWRIICYPIAASITIVADVLNNLHNRTAASDVSPIQDFVRLLRQYQKVELCDIGRMLDGCARLHKSALSAMDAGDVSLESPTISTSTSGRDVSQEQLERLKSQLATHPDHLLLAQGLVGNIPSLTKEAETVFADIFADLKAPGDGYGIFVPDHLKPESHNFRFA